MHRTVTTKALHNRTDRADCVRCHKSQAACVLFHRGLAQYPPSIPGEVHAEDLRHKHVLLGQLNAMPAWCCNLMSILQTVISCKRADFYCIRPCADINRILQA